MRSHHHSPAHPFFSLFSAVNPTIKAKEASRIFNVIQKIFSKHGNYLRQWGMPRYNKASLNPPPERCPTPDAGMSCVPYSTSSVMPFDATEHLSTTPQHCRKSLDLKNPAATQRVMLEEAKELHLDHAHKDLSKTKCFAFEMS